MATLISQVDRQFGNYEDVFVYSLNASFNGVEGDIDSAEIRVFIPDYFEIFLGDAKEPVKSVNTIAVAGGTEIVYDFGAITDLGIAVRLGFGLTFKLEAENAQSFILNPKMFINGLEFISFENEAITLSATPQFEISREIVLPIEAPSAGSAVFYKLTLQNFGDLGAEIQNVEIICNGSDIVTIDTNYPAVGKDVSSKFADISADGIEATYIDNSLRFFIPNYRGEIYEFVYRAVIDELALVGTEVDTIATWSINTVAQDDEVNAVTLSEPVYNANISLYVPDYSLPSEYICFRMNIHNVGNQILESVLFENDLPAQVQYYEFSSGAFHIGAIEQNISADYFIDYETVNGITGQLGPFNTDVNSVVDLTAVIAEGDNLTKLIWRLETLGIGVRNRISPQLLGIVNADTPIDSSILDHIHLSFDVEGVTTEIVSNETTIVANYCVLNPSLLSSVNQNPVKPNDIVTFTLRATCASSRLNNPIFAVLLGKEFEYLGNPTYNYTDLFTATSPPQPEVRLIPNFNDNGDTLVKFEFKDENAYSFRQLATIRIAFEARVAVGALGNVSTSLLMNSRNSVGVIPTSIDVYVDQDNIAEDLTVSTNYAESNTMTNRILYFVSTSSNKKVKGLLDTEYIEEPFVGRTVSGGSLEYLISVTNIGNANLEEVEIVDILPFIGDTGVIETAIPRNSEYQVFALTEVVAYLFPSEEEVSFDIYYSRSSDPVRFGPAFNVIGSVDDWSTEIPEDLSELRAFKVKIKDTVLKPAQSLRVGISANIPVGTAIGSVAWNSFATDVVYTDLSDVKQHLLAVEPEKVGVEVVPNEPDTARITGYAWFDSDGDGYYSDEEAYLNDVMAVLYNEAGEQQRVTATRQDAFGNDGRYAFENLPAGRYYVKFFIDTNKLKFTTQRPDDDNGSKANKSTGITPIIDLTSETESLNVNVGILSKTQHTLTEIMKVNNQARGMLRDVIKTQMLLTMKQEDVLEIVEMDLLK